MALQVVCARHLVAIDPFECGRGLLATCSIKIHSHDRCKKAQQTVCTKRNSNIFHVYMFCANEDSTGHRVKWGRSRYAHKWPTRNVVEHLWNIINTCFPLSLPRIAAVELITFLKESITSQISILWTPLIFGSYDVWGGTHDTNPLNKNTNKFTAYITEMHEKTCFALQIKRHSSLPTARRSAKLEALAFDSGVTSDSNATGVDTATATPCGKSSATSQLD